MKSESQIGQPLPMKATLITAPQHAMGTLYYVWKQSRHNKPLPTPAGIEALMEMGYAFATNPDYYQPICTQDVRVVTHYDAAELLGFPRTAQGLMDAGQHVFDEIEMILNEGIPVVENLNFVFHLENIPISLREQLVRHRIGVAIDPRVGADIAPLGLMEVRQIPDLAESSWWSQTSRVIPFDTFYDEGRFIVPPSLKGKRVKDTDYALFLLGMKMGAEASLDEVRIGKVEKWIEEAGTDFTDDTFDAEAYYLQGVERTQHRYKTLMEAGVHIEDCRQLIPVGATHGITWSLNLKAVLHIFGKRSSWIAQINLWGNLMALMAQELRTKVHPMLGMVLQPQCIKKGKYVGCPVDGTNAERIAGVDGMPPCPIWVRYETQKAINAFNDTYTGKYPGRDEAAWQPPIVAGVSTLADFEETGGDDRVVIREGEVSEESRDIRNWQPISLVEKEMLDTNTQLYSKQWGFNVYAGIPGEENS